MSEAEARDARYFVGRIGGAYRHLCCIAAGIVGHAETSEDIVQHAFALAIEKEMSFQSEGQCVTWLAGVVRHCALNDRRKKIRRKTTTTETELLQNVASTDAADEDVQRAAMELSPVQTAFDDQLLDALQQLEPEPRACLLLRTVEQLNYQEISELMEIPQGTAMSHVHRSRQKLRKILTNTVPGEFINE